MTAEEPQSPRAAISSRRMARRLLSGAGCAVVNAYRHGPDASLVVMHALDSDGRVLVAARPAQDHPLADVPTGDLTEVRLDVSLEAAEPGLCVTTATAHLLGLLTWLDEAETALVLAGETAGCHCPVTGEDPLLELGALAAVPGGRLGVITAERVMVHDAFGVSGYLLEEVLVVDGEAGASSFTWSSFDSLSAQEEVRAVGDVELAMVCDGVLDGVVPGLLCSHRPTGGLSPSLDGRVLCVDVAPEAVTLMRLTATCAETYQVWLPEGVRRACEAAPHVRGLVQEVLLEELLGS